MLKTVHTVIASQPRASSINTVYVRRSSSKRSNKFLILLMILFVNYDFIIID